MLQEVLDASAREHAERQAEKQTFKDRLQKNLESLKMKVRLEVPGDGNCFFYSMVDQMKRLGLPEITAGGLRNNVVDFLRHLMTVVSIARHFEKLRKVRL